MKVYKKAVDFYNDNAKAFTDHVRNPKDSIYHHYYEKPAMYDLLPDLVGKRVISIACGSGEDSSYLKKAGAKESVGIDISEELIKIAKESHSECEFKIMDMEKISFPVESFDFAYSSLAMHYSKDWTKIFKGIYKILKPGGYFLFSSVHPFYSSFEEFSGDIKERRFILSQRSSDTMDIVGDYLKSRVVDGVDMGVQSWHKSLGEITEEIHESGFKIDRIVEPLPKKDMKKISPKDYKLLSKIPYVIIFRIQKPAM